MSNFNSNIQTNNADLQAILDTINALPEAGGVELPELTNAGTSADLLINKEFINGNGNIVIGSMPNNGTITKTMDGINTKSVTIPSGYTTGGTVSLDNTIDNEVTEQADLIAQIKNAVDNLPEAGIGDLELLLQNKTVTPSTSQQTITADDKYAGLGAVTVNAMPTATQATPSITINNSGLITASVAQSAGYVTAGTKTSTKQLTTQAAKTITPSTSSQTAVASGVYTTGAVTVGAIPSTYVKPTTTKSATTYTPSTSDQTIAAGTYCSGAQTIKGDANLVASNIKSGVSIFGVNGSYVGSGESGGSSGGSSDGQMPNDFFAVQISANGDTELFPFVSGMTWGEYYASNLCPYVMNETGFLMPKFDFEEDPENINYGKICFYNSDFCAIIYYEFDANLDANDVICSVFNDGYIYTLSQYPF